MKNLRDIFVDYELSNILVVVAIGVMCIVLLLIFFGGDKKIDKNLPQLTVEEFYCYWFNEDTISSIIIVKNTANKNWQQNVTFKIKDINNNSTIYSVQWPHWLNYKIDKKSTITLSQLFSVDFVKNSSSFWIVWEFGEQKFSRRFFLD